MSRFLMLVLSLLGLLAVPVSAAADVPCAPGDAICEGLPSTTPDQGQGAVVTDAVHFPGAVPGSDVFKATQQNSQCDDCSWSLVPACAPNSNDTTNPDTLCTGATATCADASDVRYRVYLRHGTGPWELQGTVCLGPDERPATVADIGAAVREQVVNYLPDASPTFQPRSGGVVNLPTLFAAGEPGEIRTEPFDVLGFSVVVTATARWEWAFDRGVVQTLELPGGAYPNQDVAYTYADVGERAVSLTTYWTAQFTVDGEGPFAVPGPPISKAVGPIPVPVREARAELIGG